MNVSSKPYLLVLLLFSTSLASFAIADINVEYQSTQKTLRVKQCFAQAPSYVYATDDSTTAATKELSWQHKPIRFSRGYASLPEGASGCLRYTIEPQVDTNNRRSSRFKKQHPNSLLLSVDDWMWQANDHKSRPLPKITINHGEHIQVSAPWQLIERTQNQTTYQIKPTPKYANGFLAIGPMDVRPIQLGDARLRLAIMFGQNRHKNNLIEEWITQMAGTVAQVGETFPLKDIQVLVVMMTGSGGPVPWGQVNRAGGQGVLLVVNPTQNKQKLFSDWTAAHEFSHLLMPYTPNDRWLSEGFASYHQNISRLRGGLLDESTAWSKLIAGFERGRKSANQRSAPKLKQAGRRNNMQMYWGGAVIALKADVALQQQTNGEMNLSKALSGLQDCCLDTGKSWSAKSLFSELDRITQTKVFTNLYEQEVKRMRYPEYDDLLLDLGIKHSYYGGIKFNNTAPKAKIRQRISMGY